MKDSGRSGLESFNILLAFAPLPPDAPDSRAVVGEDVSSEVKSELSIIFLVDEVHLNQVCRSSNVALTIVISRGLSLRPQLAQNIVWLLTLIIVTLMVNVLHQHVWSSDLV